MHGRCEGTSFRVAVQDIALLYIYTMRTTFSKPAARSCLYLMVCLLAFQAKAQLALVQRMDVGIGSDRKQFTNWLLKQGFAFDSEAQATTRMMAQGISTVTGSTVYGETYLNAAGNIRVRLFTDTIFSIQQIQTVIQRPVASELNNFVISLSTIGFKESSRYQNRNDRTTNILMIKEDRIFTLIEPADKSYLLVKGTRTLGPVR
jgi:hypothetical protein